MQFRNLVLESYRNEIAKRLIKEGQTAEEARAYIDAYLDHPMEDVIAEILQEGKQLNKDEVNSFLRMIQKAKKVPNLLEKTIKREKGKEFFVFNGKEFKLPNERKNELSKKISSQLIGNEIDVKLEQHQESKIMMVLGTTPRIIVDLDKIPFIDSIRFDVKRFNAASQKLTSQYMVKPLTDENDVYLGIVEILIDPELYGEAARRAELVNYDA